MIKSKTPLSEEKVKVFNENIHLVYAVIAKMKLSTHPDIEDIVQEGMIGLIHSVMSHDESQGSLSTYSFAIIKGYIKNYLNRNIATILPSRRNRDYLAAYVSLGCASPQEKAEALNCSISIIKELDACTKVLSYQSILTSTGENCPEDALSFFAQEDEGYSNAESLIDFEKLIKCFMETKYVSNSQALVDRKEFFNEYFSDIIFKGKQKKFSEYAKKYGVSKQRIHQMVDKFREYAVNYFKKANISLKEYGYNE